MEQAIDYSLLDLPEISQAMFYPQQVWSPTPPEASDHLIPVDSGVSISGRFYPRDRELPSILFFHGNGEVACQYDSLAPYYINAWANLFIADFRGYGRSGGEPSFSRMISDAGVIFRYFQGFLASEQFTGSLFVKGRSLGCHSAVELAARHRGEINGLITESGSSAIERTIQRWGLDTESAAIQQLVRLHREKIGSISLPMLVIHGEMDELIPIEAAVTLCEAVSSEDITFQVIPGAGHNDLLWLGTEQYFAAVQKFISGHSPLLR
jgi:pimeloyl-ACP methyl ester carboxylesterase